MKPLDKEIPEQEEVIKVINVTRTQSEIELKEHLYQRWKYRKRVEECTIIPEFELEI